MATAKPKVKRMMFGGAAKAAPMRTQGQMQAAAKAQQAGRIPRPPSAPTTLQRQQIAQMQAGPKPSPAATAASQRAYENFMAQKIGNMGTVSQAASNKLQGVIGPMAAASARGMMKRGGAVKKATKK